MPFGMSMSPKLVVIDNNVYIGGGVLAGEKSHMVVVYNLHSLLWGELPNYEYSAFGMAEINKQLVVIGGARSDHKTNILGVWDEKEGSWTHPFPPMPTPRNSPSAVSYHRWLVVAGGFGSAYAHTSEVEILNTITREWYKAAPLPIGCSHASSVVVGNMWYLLGGNYERNCNEKSSFSVCLNAFLFDAISHTPSESSLWQALPDPPLRAASVSTVKGTLLVVGGRHDDYGSDPESAIYLFKPSNKSWIKIGDLPTGRAKCGCTVLPTGEVFVAGGFDSSQRVDIATVI